MDRAELKKIILEEVRRAWAEMNAERAVRAVNSALAGAGVLTAALAPASIPAAPEALIVLTGPVPLPSAIRAALESQIKEAIRLRALLSHSWGQSHPSADLPSGIEIVSNPEDEPAAEAAVARAAWIAFPHASLNSLKKFSLGLEDSIPSRAFAVALRSGRPVFLLEPVSIDSPEIPNARLDLLRAIDRMGAHLACPKSFGGLIQSALARGRPRPAPAPRRIVTADDIYEVARKGLSELRVPHDAIITLIAQEDALRRGVVIRAED